MLVALRSLSQCDCGQAISDEEDDDVDDSEDAESCGKTGRRGIENEADDSLAGWKTMSSS